MGRTFNIERPRWDSLRQRGRIRASLSMFPFECFQKSFLKKFLASFRGSGSNSYVSSGRSNREEKQTGKNNYTITMTTSMLKLAALWGLMAVAVAGMPSELAAQTNAPA